MGIQEKNLLVEFIKYISREEKEKLKLHLNTSGKVKQVWEYSLNAAQNKHLDKAKLFEKLKISHSHFDKITSELLQKCYDILFPERGLKLLTFLAANNGWGKHFYGEINRQLKEIGKLSETDVKNFIQQCIVLHFSISKIDRNEYIFKKLKSKFIELSPPELKQDNALWLAYKEVYLEIDHLFANSDTYDKAEFFDQKLSSLKPDFKTTSPEIIFEYFWTLIFAKQATSQHHQIFLLIDEAAEYLPKSATLEQDLLQLKKAETLYQCSRFQESYEAFSTLLKTNNEIYPRLGYWYTKYFQVCLITKHFDTAKWILDYKKSSRGANFEALIQVRDIISFAKYHILVGEYEQAFYFIRLGFIKNPKAKYFQYETELRMLEAAYFYLTGDTKQALTLCKRNIIWLNNNGYGVRTSIYPKFYVLFKAFYEQKTIGRSLKPREKLYLDNMLQSTAAVYGSILQRICEASIHKHFA